jgi:hypothetical protein
LRFWGAGRDVLVALVWEAQFWRLDSGAVVGGDAVGDPAIQVDVGIAAGGRVRPIGKDDDGGDRGKRHHCDDGVGGE